MKRSWVRVGSGANDTCPRKKRPEGRRPRAQAGGMRLPAMECQTLPAATGSWVRPGQKPPGLVLGLWPPELRERTSAAGSHPVCGHL